MINNEKIFSKQVMKKTVVGITVVGKDREGIVATFTNFAFSKGGNIEKVNQNVIKGLFGMYLEVSFSKAIDVKKYGVIFAGAQKNIGPSGVTLLIVREDLFSRVSDDAPTMQKWRTHADKDSLFNTPSTWSIYMCKLCLEYLKDIGGVLAIEKINRQKAKLLYDTLDGSNGFYKPYVKKDSRSLMNVTFNLKTPELEQKCVQEGLARGLLGLKGHRSVGGMRASIYNAMKLEGVQTLVEFLKEFQENNQ